MRVRQALFLVGGRGTRLGELAADTPKPLQLIAPEVRFLDLLIEQAARHGFTDIVLLAGHLGERVEQAYQGVSVREARVRVVREQAPMGTGGALAQARDVLAPAFLLANGDSYFDINLRALAAPPLGEKLGRIALRSMPDTSRYGAVRLQGREIAGFDEKIANAGPGLINAGLYFLSREILNSLQAPSSLEKDAFPALAARGALQGEEFAGYFLDIGLPETLEQARRELPGLLRRPAVIFDRDGVLNRDAGYTHRVEDLEWLPGARDAVRLLNDRGYLVIVATNQAGIARGFYDEAAVHVFHDRMQDELAEVGAHVDAFYFSPHHPEAAIAHYRADDHPDRKPNPGMILRALADWPIERERCFVIGDKQSDLEAASKAGLPGRLFEGGDLRSFVERVLDA